MKFTTAFLCVFVMQLLRHLVTDLDDSFLLDSGYVNLALFKFEEKILALGLSN